MLELVIDGDRRMIVAGAFRLAFSWTGDRWVHSLEHQGRGETSHRVLAISFEGDPKRDETTKVVSPTYQDLHFQGEGSTMQALLVGQSGPHHFSAVFTVERRLRESPGWPYADPAYHVQVRVDVADRCRAPISDLASTYTVDASSSDLKNATTNLVAWHLGPNNLTFATESGYPTKVAVSEAGRRATRVQALAKIDPPDPSLGVLLTDDHRRVQAVAGIDPSASTHRFEYLWHWDPDLRW